MHHLNKMMLKSKIKSKSLCRKLHYAVQSPRRELAYCEYCSASCEIRQIKEEKRSVCGCCGNEIQRERSFKFVRKVLNAGIRQHHRAILDYNLWPTKEPQYKEIYLEGGMVCELPIKFLALGRENQHPEEVMPLVEKYLIVKGYNLWIPDEINIDSICNKCQTSLKLDKHGVIFCPNCVQKYEHSDLFMR
jgi:hypothetical protein